MVIATAERTELRLQERRFDQYPPQIQGCIALGLVATEINGKFLIAGGAAYDLLTANDLTTVPSRRESGELRDVDLICSRGVNIGQLCSQAQEHLNTPVRISADLSDIFWIHDDGSAELRYHSTVIPIEPKIFEPEIITVKNVSVPVARPQTLYHLLLWSYQTAGREKDLKRAKRLVELFDQFPLPFNPSSYRVFEEFGKIFSSNRYPITKVVFAFDRKRKNLPTLASPIKTIHKLPGGKSATRYVRSALLNVERKLSK